MSTSALLCAESAPERQRSTEALFGVTTAVAAYLVLVTGVFVTFALLVLGYLASRTPSGQAAGSSRGSGGRR